MSQLHAGAGIVRPEAGVVPILVIALLATAAIVGAMLVGPGRSRIAIVTLGVIGIAAYVAVGQVEAIGTFDDKGGSFYPGPPATAVRPDQLDENVTVIDARRNEVFPIAVTVTNGGFPPLTIAGIEQGDVPPLAPHFVGIRLLKDAHNFAPSDAAATVEFQPITLRSGERVDIVALVDPGPCVAPHADGGWYLIESIPVAYDVLGWRRTVRFDLPGAAAIPAPASCP